MVHEMRRLRGAIDAWRKSLALAEPAATWQGWQKPGRASATSTGFRANLARALEHQTRGLEIRVQLKNVGAVATAHFAIGQLHALQRNYPRASS